jgi:hypothetical protein
VLQWQLRCVDVPGVSARTVLTAIRWIAAIAFGAVAVKATIVAFHIPIEAGGILFGPLLLGVAAVSAVAALACVVPWWRHAGRGGDLGFWTWLADLLFPW